MQGFKKNPLFYSLTASRNSLSMFCAYLLFNNECQFLVDNSIGLTKMWNPINF